MIGDCYDFTFFHTDISRSPKKKNMGGVLTQELLAKLTDTSAFIQALIVDAASFKNSSGF